MENAVWVEGWGGGGGIKTDSQKKRYEGVWFDVASITRGVGGCQLKKKNTLRSILMATSLYS